MVFIDYFKGNGTQNFSKKCNFPEANEIRLIRKKNFPKIFVDGLYQKITSQNFFKTNKYVYFYNEK